MSAIEDYMEQSVAAWRKLGRTFIAGYVCLEEFVLLNGREYKPQPLPDQYKRMAFKKCFGNAYLTALAHPELVYVEGFGWTERTGILIHHAWCADKDGNVIDPTWPDGEAYFGIEYGLDKIEEPGCSVIDDWKNEWPELKANPRRLTTSERSAMLAKRQQRKGKTR